MPIIKDREELVLLLDPKAVKIKNVTSTKLH